jgi:glyoxylase-like metal-dependent hydrolase (beta-lactamase superfamily II)
VELVKFTHACVRLEDGARRLVIDPGMFSEVDEALDGVDSVLITHEHQDHVDAERLSSAARANSRMRIWAPAAVAGQLAGLGDQITAVGADESFDADGFAVRTFGGQHAVIHPSMPVVANVCYLVDGQVYHPGDSFFVPPVTVPTLLLPLHAPWSKVSEVIDFVISVRAPEVHQIHDGLLNELGLGVVEGHVGRFGAQHGSSYRHLSVRESVSLKALPDK